MRAPRFLPIFLLLGLVVGSRAVAADTWLKLQTKDVIILSDASRRDIVEFAVGYAAYRHVFAETFSPKQPPPATVLLFRRLSKLQDYIPESKQANTRTVSYTSNIDGDALIALAVDGDRHQALEQTYEFDTAWELGRIGYSLPIWMAQGAGEVLASLDVDKAKCVVGDGPQWCEEGWRRTQLDWHRFFEISNTSEEYVGRLADGTYHAQAWALMHWVLLNDGNSIERFNRLAEKLHSTDALQAVEAVLNVSEKELTRKIDHHLMHGGSTRQYAFDSATLRKELNPEPAPAADVAVQMANLLFATHKTAQAEQELMKAKSLAPESPPVKEALARQALRDGEPEYAIKLYREAIAAGSISPRAYLLSAKQWLDDNSSGRDREGDGGPNVDHALTEIHKALQLDPGDSYGYQLLGRAFFVATKATEDEIAELSPGVIPGDAGANVRYYRALLYRRLGHQQDYAADLHAIIADNSVAERLRASARDQFVRDTLAQTGKKVDQLVASHRFEEANALIDGCRKDPVNSAFDDTYAKMAAWVAETRVLADFKAAYDKRDWANARAIGAAFLEKYPRSRAAASVRHALMNLPAEKESDTTAAMEKQGEH